jgi:SAM-dependent methyltransferase
VPELYDTIGRGYRELRRPDPRIAETIHRALGRARTVVNVGAGTGSYEPEDRGVVAVEPAMTMIGQRPLTGPPAVRATSAALPFRDDTFDASMAILTVHHWSEQRTGLEELRRVAREHVVILTWDPGSAGFWLTDYISDIPNIDRPMFPWVDDFEKALGSITVTDVPIPHDCTDGFLGAYWRRPEAYLDPRVRSAMSVFSKTPNADTGLERLRADLESGAWHDMYGHILSETSLDLGYRLIVAEP